MRAKSRGAKHTHSKLLRLLRGMDLFVYAWGLTGAVVEDNLEFAVEKAAMAIEYASRGAENFVLGTRSSTRLADE
jgi:hypothetical protein